MKKYACVLMALGMYFDSLPLLANCVVECRMSKVERIAVESRKSNFEGVATSSNSNLTTQQQTMVTGKVAFDGMPMMDVTVSVKGKSVVTVSGENGVYSIAAGANDVLVFSYVGFTTVSEPVNGRSQINVTLKEDATALQEITVNAGYYTVKESERTGSIAKITAKDIEKQPVTNVLATMQGRMAGVAVTQDTGVPGGGFHIAIRGQNSLRRGGNDPLYVIDGVPYGSEAIGTIYTSAALSQPASPLNSINPADIASIEILKDADATAIYGSRGANGVVLITTKRGHAGKTQFTTNVSGGFGNVTRFRKLMRTPQYLQMRREAYSNDGLTEYSPADYDINGTWDQTRDTDWQEELIGGTAQFNTVQTSLSGGSSQTQFLLSGNYSAQTTVYPGDFKYRKGNVHLNLNHESENKRFKVNFTGGYTVQDNDQPAVDFTRDAVTLAPNAPALFDASGNLNWENNTFNNPLRYLVTSSDSQTYDFIANSMWRYELLDGLELRSSFGYTDLRHAEYNAQPSTIFLPSYGLGSEASLLFTTKTNRRSWIVEPQLHYERGLGNGKLELLAGSTFQQQTGDQLVTMGYGFSSNSLIYNPGSASTYLVLNSDATVYKYQAIFGRVNYSYADKYFLNFTGRRDGSSRFGTDNRFADFGAVGAAWLFSKEAVFGDNPILSFGKLRGSYGTTGNDQIGDYQYLDTYRNSGSNYQGVNGLWPTRLYNPNFGWELNKKLELALETGFFKDRIFTSVAWYRNRSSSQLTGIPLPGTTGFTSLQANLDAEVENSGFELGLRTVNFQGSKFGWVSSLNFTAAKNKLLSFPDLESSSYSDQLVVGEALNIVKVYHYTGINPQTGIYQFEDVNGDGVISAPDDRQVVKDLNPKYYGGLQNQFRYGALQLDFLFQFVKQLNYNQNYSSGVPGTAFNQPIEVGNHWQNPGDAGPYQIYTSGSNGDVMNAASQFSESDASISDASYIRLKNVALSFDLPERWTKRAKCRLSLQGQNLLTITSFKGGDPEFRSPGFLPPLRMFTSSIQLTF